MDYRNIYQAKATKTRAQNDVDELQEQNKWLDWSEFTALISKLRSDWNDEIEFMKAAEQKPTVSDALSLHDLLLLGLYSCVPGRGAEVRLLQSFQKSPSSRKLNDNSFIIATTKSP